MKSILILPKRLGKSITLPPESHWHFFYYWFFKMTDAEVMATARRRLRHTQQPPQPPFALIVRGADTRAPVFVCARTRPAPILPSLLQVLILVQFAFVFFSRALTSGPERFSANGC